MDEIELMLVLTHPDSDRHKPGLDNKHFILLNCPKTLLKITFHVYLILIIHSDLSRLDALFVETRPPPTFTTEPSLVTPAEHSSGIKNRLSFKTTFCMFYMF